jgi:nucleoside-diphosphate-sugar epimerase
MELKGKRVLITGADGSNSEISIKDTFELIKKEMYSDVNSVVDPERIRPGKTEVQRLWCDNTKINTLTGFEPAYSMEVGVHKTIEWFTNPDNLKKFKTNIYNV